MPSAANRTFAALLFTSLVAIAGCTTSDPDVRPSASTSAQPTAAETTAKPDSVVVTRTATVSPDVDIADEQTLPSDDRVVVGFAGLAVHGELAVLTLTFTPEFTNSGQNERISLFDMFDNHTAEPTLIDMENLRRYSVATGRGGVSLAPNAVKTTTPNHHAIALNYTFAAPTLDVVDVYIDDMSLFSDVEVDR